MIRSVIIVFIVLFTVCSADAQIPEGEYQSVKTPELDLDSRLILFCNKSFLLEDSALIMSGTWKQDHKKIFLILSCNFIKRSTDYKIVPVNATFIFDVRQKSLTWSPYSERNYRVIRTGNNRVPLKKYKKNLPRNMFRLKTSFSC